MLEVCQSPDEEDGSALHVAFAVLTKEHDTASVNVSLTPKMGIRISERSTDCSGAVIHVTGHTFPAFDHGNSGVDMIENNDLYDNIFDNIVIDDDSDEVEGDKFDDVDKNDNFDEKVMDDSDIVLPLSTDVEGKGSAQPSSPKADAPKNKSNKKNAGNSSGKRSERDEAEEGGPLKKKGYKSLPVRTHVSGLRYQDTLVGAGKPVMKGHNVAIQYTLRLDSGKVVDKAERKRPFKFRLGIGECIKGMDIGILGMREGGERHIVVPPDLGYGDQRLPGIPPNSTLYFDVAVVKAF